ncbi:MAG TPA: DUF1634 domain-containing protein [Tepidisphaeraceae bacterium]|jgi:uncharacterized membrane protein|nr:DUF1634 domain-containing protein [Tepidisphaeraceae bacterium]
MTEPDRSHPPAEQSTIQNVSAWVLRIGVILSVAVMLIGIVISFIHTPPTIDEIKTFRFDHHLAHIWHGIIVLRGRYIIEVGIYLLVLTPVMRVFMSMILFATVERDRLYTVVTLAVLLLTLAGLLYL